MFFRRPKYILDFLNLISRKLLKEHTDEAFDPPSAATKLAQLVS